MKKSPDRRTASGQLLGPRDAGNFVRWRAARDKAIEQPRGMPKWLLKMRAKLREEVKS